MRADLETIFRAGVAACRPERVLPAHLPSFEGRVFILALGKSAAAMARVAETHYRGQAEGLAVSPYGVADALERVELIHSGHPLPDEASLAAAERLLELASGAGADDLVLVLLSGGASSLACLPSEGLSLSGKRALTEKLLRSGAEIGEINCVRRHLSRFKGGRLALAARPARLLALAISDVAGDLPADIGSGPTVADPTTVNDAEAVLRRYGLEAPAAAWSETPKQVDSDFRIVARPADAIAAAAREALRLGYCPVPLGECRGEARAVGHAHAELALEAEPGSALISGGELVVRVTGAGTGGRNHEYALAAALRLGGAPGIAGLAADTDGIDGNSGAAGAFFGGEVGKGAAAALEGNDSGGYFARSGGQFATGPTGTNVNDLRIILIAP